MNEARLKEIEGLINQEPRDYEAAFRYIRDIADQLLEEVRLYRWREQMLNDKLLELVNK